MGERVAIYIPKKNYLNEATNYYSDMVLEGLRCHDKNIYTKIDQLKSFDIIFVLDAKSLFFVKLRYPLKKVVTWYQGVVPEEALLQFGSKLKYAYWRIFEFLSLKLSFINIFVSDCMRAHYQKVYGYNDFNYVIIPCFNKVFSKDKIVANKNKYNSVSFVYAGSLHKWQCIDQTLTFFKYIQKTQPSATLLFLTFDTIAAQEIIKKYEIENVEVLSVPECQVEEYIAKCRFGFLLRENNTVNNVATPTKMSTYLSVGTIPVMTDAITDFNENINTQYLFTYGSSEDLNIVSKKFIDHLNKEVEVETLIDEYASVFSGYYNREYYIQKINAKLDHMLKKG